MKVVVIVIRLKLSWTLLFMKHESWWWWYVKERAPLRWQWAADLWFRERERVMPSPPLIVFLGPPGSGKGTYAKILTTALASVLNGYGTNASPRGWAAYIDVGAMLRRRCVSGSDKASLARGELLSSSVVEDLLETEIASVAKSYSESTSSSSGLIVLDGFPRTSQQASWLLRKYFAPLVFSLSLHEPALISKMRGRLVCDKCGVGFNDANVQMQLPLLCMKQIDGNERESEQYQNSYININTTKADPDTESAPLPIEVILPHLPPPLPCRQFMSRRDDDATIGAIQMRLEQYKLQRPLIRNTFMKAGYTLFQHMSTDTNNSLSRIQSETHCNDSSSISSSSVNTTRVLHHVELTRGIPETAPLLVNLALRIIVNFFPESYVSMRKQQQDGQHEKTIPKTLYQSPLCGLLND